LQKRSREFYENASFLLLKLIRELVKDYQKKIYSKIFFKRNKENGVIIKFPEVIKS